MDAVLLGKHMGLKKIKDKEPCWNRLAVLQGDGFYAHVVLQYVLQKVSLKAPSVRFLTPKGHFGTQTSYHSYSTATLWTFSRGKFSKGGWALPWQSLQVFLDCTAAKTQLMKHLAAEPKPSASQAHALHRAPWTCTHGWEHRAKWFSVPLCTEQFGALHCF